MKCPGCRRKLVVSAYMGGMHMAMYCPYCNKEIPIEKKDGNDTMMIEPKDRDSISRPDVRKYKGVLSTLEELYATEGHDGDIWVVDEGFSAIPYMYFKKAWFAMVLDIDPHIRIPINTYHTLYVEANAKNTTIQQLLLDIIDAHARGK